MKLSWLILAGLLSAAHSEETAAAEKPAAARKEETRAALPKVLKVEAAGLARDAIVFAPAPKTESAAPLVFVFHGHGGTARQAALSIGIHRQWPEAIVVYPQGVPTPGRLTDPEGKRNGWQQNAGDQGDRDLAFFDALLARLKKDHAIDAKRIYATGHSNGGSFTYLLWETRRDVFAAFAPSGAVAARSARKLKPAPAMHIAGKADPLVKFAWQEKMMGVVRALNEAPKEGEPWAEHSTIYGAKSATPVVQFIHPGGHEFPADASALIARFFKEHARESDR